MKQPCSLFVSQLHPDPHLLSRPNGLSAAFTYKPNNAPGNSARALASITHKFNTTPLASHTYGYDPAGRITTWKQAGQGLTAASWSYGHNADDELLSATKTADSAPNTPIDSENWSLDAAGNWLSHSRGSGAVMETRTHNSMNHLTAIGGSGSTVIEGSVNEFARVTVNGASAQLSKDPVGDGFRYRRTVPVTTGSNTVTVSATDTGGATTTKQWQFNVPAASRSFSYDSNGNTLSDGQRTMTWDVKNRLRTVTKSGTTWKWDYDHADRRVKEYRNNTLTKIFIWSGTNVVQERDAASTITRTHYSGGFSDGATPTTGTKYQTLTDHLGHVREIVDANGAVVTRYDYTSYQGPVKVSGTVEATFQTIGRYYHHTGSGMELALYRAYDAELGRWLSEDPLGEEGGLDLYGYVRNHPTGLIDPLGLTYGSNFGFLLDYLTGLGPRNRTYGPNDFQNTEMQNSTGAQHMRDAFKKGGCKTLDSIGYSTPRAAWDTLLSPSQWDNTGLQVGGFLGQATNNGNGTVTYSINNTAGAHSFFYHAVPDAAWSSGPLSNINQSFSWTEPLPCSSSPPKPAPSYTPPFHSYTTVCLAEGTMVATKDGYMTIENLRKGMQVWGMDWASQRWRLNVVDEVLRNETIQPIIQKNTQGAQVRDLCGLLLILDHNEKFKFSCYFSTHRTTLSDFMHPRRKICST